MKPSDYLSVLPVNCDICGTEITQENEGQSTDMATLCKDCCDKIKEKVEEAELRRVCNASQ